MSERRPELDAVLKRARAAYNAMTPEEKREYDEAQRRSWGRGMAPCEHGIRDWETCPNCRKEQEPKP
jgi:hypothetical protein